MGTPWDNAAEEYLAEWVPRFLPYHADLVREAVLKEGQKVLVVTAGPGAEVIAVARAVGETGHVHATDSSDEMIKICREQVGRADFGSQVTCSVGAPDDTSGGPWDAVLCAFGLWQLEDRKAVVTSWANALDEQGKVGVITWGPPDEDDATELFTNAIRALEPAYPLRAHRIHAERASIELMFEEAGLVMVRHTIVRHTMNFASAEAFFRAQCEASSYRRVVRELGTRTMDRVAAHFYDKVGGPNEPLSFRPAATVAIAARPGAEVDLLHRLSVRAPPSSTSL